MLAVRRFDGSTFQELKQTNKQTYLLFFNFSKVARVFTVQFIEEFSQALFTYPMVNSRAAMCCLDFKEFLNDSRN